MLEKVTFSSLDRIPTPKNPGSSEFPPKRIPPPQIPAIFKPILLKLVHMVLKLEQFNLEKLANKNTVRILRLLVMRPYLSFGLSEISAELKISKSNVLRVMNVLVKNLIVIEQKSGRKKVYRINGELELVRDIWHLFMIEMRYNLKPEFRNAIDLFYNSVKKDVDVFIVFGSLAHGLETERSDMEDDMKSNIDILIAGKKRAIRRRFDFLPYRFELHNYKIEDLEKPRDFLALEAINNGIVYNGEIFDILKEIRVFPKAYLVYRLERTKEFLEKAKKLKGNAREYYRNLSIKSIGEIESLVYKKRVMPKGSIKIMDKKLLELEERLSKEGENIWLI